MGYPETLKLDAVVFRITPGFGVIDKELGRFRGIGLAS